mmetsp:Transcript_91747/g.262311  ORF Transcript_91747/g.262311 Transcript_91747/m.262311 type:complete len:203 (-) Transcript_91747:864-1472(-)
MHIYAARARRRAQHFTTLGHALSHVPQFELHTPMVHPWVRHCLTPVRLKPPSVCPPLPPGDRATTLIMNNYFAPQSFASSIPAAPRAKVASLSGMEGESYTLHTRFSPRPLRSCSRVWLACAMMLPPIGFVASLAKLMPSGFATTWRRAGLGVWGFGHGQGCEQQRTGDRRLGEVASGRGHEIEQRLALATDRSIDRSITCG